MSHAGGSRGTVAAPGAAWKTGRFTPAFYQLNNPGDYGGYNSGILGGQRTGSVDWDSVESLQAFSGHAADRLRNAEIYLARYRKNPGKDYRYTKEKWGGSENPYYDQGLGPKNYIGKYHSDKKLDEVRWFKASKGKFDSRISELGAIADAPATSGFGSGTQGAYDEQQSAKKLLGKPFPEAAAAAEQLRLERGGGSARRGGGGGVATSGRQGARATAAEQSRLGRSQTSGGSSPRRRLRASNLLAQPLGGGWASRLLGSCWVRREDMGLPGLIAASLIMSAAQTGISLSAANRKTPETKPEPPADIGREGAITAAKMAEMRRRNQRSGGRASTIMSGSPLGVPAPATTAKKYLTGA